MEKEYIRVAEGLDFSSLNEARSFYGELIQHALVLTLVLGYLFFHKGECFD